MPHALATNHQHGDVRPDRPGFTRTMERRAHLEMLFARQVAPEALRRRFLEPPLFRTDYAGGFGTLFTAEYAPADGGLTLLWPGQEWHQSLGAFQEGSRTVTYAPAPPSPEAGLETALAALRPFLSRRGRTDFDAWLAAANRGEPDWERFGDLFSENG